MSNNELAIDAIKVALKDKLIRDDICLSQFYHRDVNVISWHNVTLLPHNPLLGTQTQSVSITDFIKLFPKAFTKGNIRNKRVLLTIREIEGKALIRNEGTKGYLKHVNRWIEEGIKL